MKKRKVIGSAIIGNIVEYYDFGLYAVYAPLFGELFFPQVGDYLIQSLLAFGIFAVGFMMRPLGGIFFGYIGDKLGRKTSLTISIVGMAVSTFLIGLLPTYEQVGLLAPILLTLIRLFQGLCVGGEGAGVAIFVLEHTEGFKPGLVGSIVMASNMVGTQIALIVGIIINHFFPEPYAWRYAFWIGGAMGTVGIYMRYQLNETPVFEAHKETSSVIKNPIKTAFRDHFKTMILVMIVGGATSAVAYTIRGYLNTFFYEVLYFGKEEALYLTSVGLFTMIIFLPFYGIIADKIGYNKFFYIVNCAVILTIVPIFMMLTNEARDIKYIFLATILLGNLAAAICAPAYPYVIKAFEVEIRFTGVAFSWNLGNAIMGGTTPMIATLLTKEVSVIAPAYYLILVSVTFIIIKFWVTRGRGKHDTA
jgi:MHS family proline/betaine transporter-like MFS transporter